MGKSAVVSADVLELPELTAKHRVILTGTSRRFDAGSELFTLSTEKIVDRSDWVK